MEGRETWRKRGRGEPPRSELEMGHDGVRRRRREDPRGDRGGGIDTGIFRVITVCL